MARTKDFCKELAESFEYKGLVSAVERRDQEKAKAYSDALVQRMEAFEKEAYKTLFENVTRKDISILTDEDPMAKLQKKMLMWQYGDGLKKQILMLKEAMQDQREVYLPAWVEFMEKGVKITDKLSVCKLLGRTKGIVEYLRGEGDRDSADRLEQARGEAKGILNLEDLSEPDEGKLEADYKIMRKYAIKYGDHSKDKNHAEIEDPGKVVS